MTGLIVSETEPGGAPLGREAWRMFRRNKAAMVGLFMLIAVIAMTFLGPWLYDGEPLAIKYRALQPPGTEDIPLLGSDARGRDVLAGVFHGGATVLRVALTSALIIVFIGVTIGAIAGFYGGLLDELLMRFTEVFQVLPALLFAMVVVALWDSTPVVVSIAIGIVLWPQLARLTRAEFLRLKNQEFVKAARAIGASDFRIMFRVILPNAMPPLIVATTLVMGSAVLFEAYLAFLGIGDGNAVSWGLMISKNRDSFLGGWWIITFPGIAISLTVLSFSLIGDGLQDAFNPKLRGR